jgi:hypothetical protein
MAVIPETPDQIPNRRRLWLVALILVVVAATVGATVAVIVVQLGDSSSAAAVTLEPALSVGTDPFTDSVVPGPTAVVPDGVRTATTELQPDPTTHTRVAVGTAPGLYGGSGDAQVCDSQKLVAFFAQHQDKATAWARVFGITPNQIAAYAATLTPVLLTSDTLVTNHGYHNGVATSLQSVLQAGTAVLVDPTGTPRVKCNCGNPLAPPNPTALSGADLRGSPWRGYTRSNVTIVRPGPRTTNFTLVNIHTGDTYEQAAGSGSSGGQWVATETSTSGTTIVTSRDGSVWATASVIPNEAVTSLVWGNGKWTAVSNFDNGAATHVLESTDLRTWKQIGLVSDSLVDIAYGEGRWVATGLHWTPGLLATSTPHSNGVVYTSTDAIRWSQDASSDIENGYNGFEAPIAYGSGTWVTTSGAENFTGGDLTQKLTMLVSTDGVHWTPNGGTADTGLSNPSLAYGSRTWVLGADAIQLSHDAKSWSPTSISVGASPTIDALAFGNGRFLAVDSTQGSTTVLASTDAKNWTPVGTVDAELDALAYGGNSSPRSAPTSPSTTIAPSGPPCTREALQDAFSHDPEDDQSTAIVNAPEAPQCSGGWAIVHYQTQGQLVLAVFRANGGAWQLAPWGGSNTTAGRYCTDPNFPAELRPRACN